MVHISPSLEQLRIHSRAMSIILPTAFAQETASVSPAAPRRAAAQAAVDTGATCGVLAAGGGTKTVPRRTAVAAKAPTKRVRLDWAGAIANFDVSPELTRLAQDLSW